MKFSLHVLAFVFLEAPWVIRCTCRPLSRSLKHTWSCVGTAASNEASTAERAASAASLIADLVAFEIRFRVLDKREALLADPYHCNAISFRTIWVSPSLTTHPKRLGWCVERSPNMGGDGHFFFKKVFFCWMKLVWVEVEWIFFCWMKIVWVEVEWVFVLKKNSLSWSWMYYICV